jgi:hypothetical protein
MDGDYLALCRTSLVKRLLAEMQVGRMPIDRAWSICVCRLASESLRAGRADETGAAAAQRAPPMPPFPPWLWTVAEQLTDTKPAL